MIVEFVGASGAGKSTLIRMSFEELARRGIDVHRWNLDGGRDIVKSRRNFNINGVLEATTRLSSTRLCLQQLRPPPGVPLRSHWRQLRWMLGAARSIRKLRQVPGVHLVDEGPRKLAGARAPRLGDGLDRLLAALPKVDLTVACVVDPDVAVERVRARGSGSATPDPDRVRRWAVNHRDGLRLLASRDDPVLVIDTSGGPNVRDDQVARIVGAIAGEAVTESDIEREQGLAEA